MKPLLRAKVMFLTTLRYQWPLIKRFGTGLMMLATATAILLYLVWNWRQLAEYQWAFMWPWAAGAASLMFAFCVLAATGWFMLIGWNGVAVSWAEACWTWSRSTLTRYLPTPIWLMGSRIYLTMKLGVSWQGASVSFGAELTGTIAAAVTVALLATTHWLEISSVWVVILAAVIAVIVLPVLYRFFLRLIGQDSTFHKCTHQALVKWSCLYVMAFLVYGMAHVFAFRSVIDEVPPLTLVLGVSAFAWVIGTLNVFSPGGIGTREAILIFGLRDYADIPILLAVGIVARMTFLVGELFLFCLLKMWDSVCSRRLGGRFCGKLAMGTIDTAGIEP